MNYVYKIGRAVFRKGVTIYKCRKCGVFISITNGYCPECGKKVDWED